MLSSTVARELREFPIDRDTRARLRVQILVRQPTAGGIVTPQRPQLISTSVRHGRDVVVLGASAGGVPPLLRLASQLPADLPASLFVVVHRGNEGPNLLAQVIGQTGELRAVDAADGMPIEQGVIYVAPPDFHTLIEQDTIRVIRGPKENRHRPAIDPLFRSAAWTYGPRVIGVLLSGARNDGAAGLWAIRQCGGIVIVQDPADARFPSMPASVLETMDPDHCVSGSELSSLIDRLVRTTAPAATGSTAASQVGLEAQMAQLNGTDIHNVHSIGKLSHFTCPTCHGALWEVDDEHVLRFRCHTGHAFTAEALSLDQDEAAEAAVYSAMRALKESAAVSRNMAQRARDRQHDKSATMFDQKAREADANVEVLEDLLRRRRV